MIDRNESQASSSGRHVGACCSARDVISVVVAIAVGLVLQFAAVAKITGPSSTRIFGDVRLDYVIGGAEILIVMILLAFHRWRYVWPVIAILFSGFGGYAIYRASFGQPCGCFGKLWQPPDGVSLTIDIGFAIIALALCRLHGLARPLLAATAITMIVAAGGGYVYAWQTEPPSYTEYTSKARGTDAVTDPKTGSTGERSAPEQSTPQPQTAPDIDRDTEVPMSNNAAIVGSLSAPDIDLEDAEYDFMASPLMEDVRVAGANGPAWLVMIYNPDCHTCQESLDFFFEPYKFESEERDDQTLKVRMFSMPDLTDQLEIPDWAWPGTPTVLLIQDGLVTRQWYNEPVPDPYAVRDALEAGTPLD